MDNFDRKSRVYKPAPWRYRCLPPTNEQSVVVARKVIRKNQHGLEIYDDYFDDGENKSSETEDDSIAMQAVAGDPQTGRRVKRMSPFSPVKSSSEDELSDKMSTTKKPRIMVMDTNGRLIDRDEVPRMEAELKRRRFEGPICSDTSRERHSGLEDGKQLEFSLPRHRKRLSSTPNINSQNDANVSSNLTKSGINDAIQPSVEAHLNRSQKSFNRHQLVENSMKICDRIVNSKQLDSGNEKTAQVRTSSRTNSHKRSNGEKYCNETLNLDLDERLDADFELPPDQPSYMLKSLYENMKLVKKRKAIHENVLKIYHSPSPAEQRSRLHEWLDDTLTDGRFRRLNHYAKFSYDAQRTFKTLDEVVEDEDIQDESLGRNRIKLPIKKKNVTAELSSFHEGRGDSDAASGYKDDETSTEVSKAKIPTGKRLKSTKGSAGKTKKINGTKKAVAARNKKTKPAEQPARRNLRSQSINAKNVVEVKGPRRDHDVTEEQVPGRSQKTKKAVDKQVLRESLNKITDEQSSSNRRRKPTSLEKVIAEPVPRRGPLRKKLSLNKSQAIATVSFSHEISVNDGSEEHGLRRSLRLREISLNVDEEEQISPNVDEEEEISPNVDEEEKISPNKVDSRSGVQNRSRNGLVKIRDEVGSQRVQSGKNRDERTKGAAKPKFAAGVTRGSSLLSDSPVLQNVGTKPSSRRKSQRRKYDSQNVGTKSSSRGKSRRTKRVPQTTEQVQDPLLRKQLIIPKENEDENLRRSKRTRMPRLATWDWERPRYRLDPMGLFVIDSISTPIPDPHSNVLRKKRPKAVFKKTKQDADPHQSEDNLLVDKSVVSVPVEALPVINPDTNEIVYIDLFSKFPSVEFCGPDGAPAASSDPYVMSVNLKHTAFSFGFLFIRPKCVKQAERLRKHSMIFNVISGNVTATVHCSSFVAKKGDVFLVPMGNQYRLQNLALSEARLSFTRING